MEREYTQTTWRTERESGVISMFQQLKYRNKLHIGIDLGTTKTGVALIGNDETEPQVLKLNNDLNRWYMPSVVALSVQKNKTTRSYDINAIGWDAITQAEGYSSAVEKPEFSNIAFFERTKLALAREINKSHVITENIQDFQEVKPEYISAILLQKVRKAVAEFTNKVSKKDLNTRATISIPANWSPLQKKATKFSARLAGFEEVDLVEEPIAAISYVWQVNSGINQIGTPPENILLVDFGGGTCDIAVVRVDSKKKEMEVEHIAGMNGLGGELIDELIIQDSLENSQNTFPLYGPATTISLRRKAEEIKISLNDNYLLPAAVNIIGIKGLEALKVSGERDFINGEKISTQRLHKLLLTDGCHELLRRGGEQAFQLIEDQPQRTIIRAFDALVSSVARRTRDSFPIDRIILVGGSAMLYFVKPIILEHFPQFIKKQNKIFIPDDQAKAIVRGAALHEKWRCLNRSYFQPKLFYDIRIPTHDLSCPLDPVVKAPRNLPSANNWSDPFYVNAETNRFSIELIGDAENAHPDDGKYNVAEFFTYGGVKLDPHRHQIQVGVSITSDGIISFSARENRDKIPLIYQDPYPLSGEIFENRRQIIYKQINGLGDKRNGVK